MVTDVFTGRWFPLTLMPKLLFQVSKILPFQFIWYYPTMYLLGKTEVVGLENAVFLMTGWTAFLLFLAILLWKKGLKKYSAYG